MADVLTNVSTVANALQAEYWQRQFLSTLEANLLFSKFGLEGELPGGMGRSAFWARFENIAYTLSEWVGASEGKDPDAAAVSVNVVSATLAQYKQWYRLGDIWQGQSFPQTKENLVKRMGYVGSLTVDTIIRDQVFSAGGSAQIGGTAVARTSMKRNGSFSLDVQEIREAVRRLRKDNVPTFGNLYVGCLHPHADYDLQGDSSWTNIVQYTTEGINRAYQGKTGAVYGSEFYITTQAKVVANGASAGASADVAQTYLFGQDYFGVVKPRDIEVIIKDPAPASPLNSYSSYGWKLWMAAKQLQSKRMVRIETVLSADV